MFPDSPVCVVYITSKQSRNWFLYCPLSSNTGMIFHGSSEAGLALHPHEMLSSLGPSPEDELQKRGEGGRKKK